MARAPWSEYSGYLLFLLIATQVSPRKDPLAAGNLGKWTMRVCDFMVDHLGEWDSWWEELQ